MKKQCIVTGGAGFIGSHLCELLLKKNYTVVAVDNLSTGDINNISSFKDNSDFTFIKADIVESFTQELNDKLSKSEYIFHLASPASPNPKSSISYFSLPLETLEVNSVGTKQLLEHAHKNNSKFLYASTSEVYGDPLMHPQKESYYGNVNSFGPRSCYDEAKRFGEALCYTYLHKFHADIRVVRIFNTYGPRMNKEDGRAVVEFIVNSINNQPIPIFGDGQQTRSFCYVSDLIDGIVSAMFLENTCGEVYNLGNPAEISMLDLSNLIIKLTSSKSLLKYEKLLEDDPKRRQPDIAKAQKELNFVPKISLEEGLKKTIDYFKNMI